MLVALGTQFTTYETKTSTNHYKIIYNNVIKLYLQKLLSLSKIFLLKCCVEHCCLNFSKRHKGEDICVSKGRLFQRV